MPSERELGGKTWTDKCDSFKGIKLSVKASRESNCQIQGVAVQLQCLDVKPRSSFMLRES